MKFRILSFLILLPGFIFAQKDTLVTGLGGLIIHPIYHASMVWEWNDEVVYFDPHGEPELFEGMPAPTLVLITHDEAAHFDPKTLNRLKLGQAKLIAPQEVVDQLGMLRMKFESVTVLNRGEIHDWKDATTIEAVPLYSMNVDAGEPHLSIGEGNGYIINMGSKRLYISGTAEYIPEMHSVRDIDVAFVPLEAPATIDVGAPTETLLAFRPKVVYPTQAAQLDDLQYFTAMIEQEAPEMEVRVREWY